MIKKLTTILLSISFITLCPPLKLSAHQTTNSYWALSDTEAEQQQSIPQEGIYTLMLDSTLGPLTYYNQGDSRWSDYPYGAASDKLVKYGCGPTTMAMLITSLTNEVITPPAMSDWAVEHGYWARGSGSYHTLIPESAKAFGLQVEPLKAYTPQALLETLRSGKLMVALMKKGHFTQVGHFIILTQATDNGKIRIADSATYENTLVDWDPEIILKEINKKAAGGGPIWIISTD